MHVVTCKLFFKSDDIRTVSDARLKFGLTGNLGYVFPIELAEGDGLHRKFFFCSSMLRQVNLAEGAVAQLFDQIILVELVLKTLFS